MRKLLTSVAILSSLLLTACTDADYASNNLSKAADNFEVNRRFTYINGITDSILLEVEGRCSLGNNDTNRRMSVTCKTGPNSFKKHIMGISDNVTFVAEQLDGFDASVYHYRFVIKPQAIIPDIDLKFDKEELNKDRY